MQKKRETFLFIITLNISQKNLSLPLFYFPLNKKQLNKKYDENF